MPRPATPTDEAPGLSGRNRTDPSACGRFGLLRSWSARIKAGLVEDYMPTKSELNPRALLSTSQLAIGKRHHRMEGSVTRMTTFHTGTL